MMILRKAYTQENLTETMKTEINFFIFIIPY